MVGLEKLSRIIANSFADQGIVSEDETEIYQFGLNQLFFFVINMMTSVAIGLAFGKLTECLVFTLAYMLLRRYTGGYHAKTSLRCYCMSVCLTTVVLWGISEVITHEWYRGYFIILLVSMSVIFFNAPIESVNKPLDDEEYKKYRKKSLEIMTIEFVLILILFFWNRTISVCIATAVVTAAGMLILSMPEKARDRNDT